MIVKWKTYGCWCQDISKHLWMALMLHRRRLMTGEVICVTYALYHESLSLV